MRFDVINDVQVGCKDIELQGICITGNGQPHAQKKIFLLLAYRPPSGDSARAVEIILNKVHDLGNIPNPEILILGDLNWDCIDENSSSLCFVEEICDELDLKQIIKTATRISYNRNTLLDVILTNMKNIACVGCINVNLSDHLPVFVSKKRLSGPVEFDYINKRSLRNYDVDMFSERLSDLVWSIVDLLYDVNKAWEMSYKGVLIEVNKMCPYREFRVRSNRQPWFNTTLCNLGNDRDILHRNYRRSGSNNKDIFAKFIEKRKEFNSEVKAAKKTFYADRISQCRGDAKNFWKLIDTLLGSKSNKTIDRVYLPGTNLLCREDETVDIVNKFFAQIGSKIGEDIKNLGIRNRNFTQLDEEISYENWMVEFQLINVGIMLDILKELDCNKSSGVTDIST